MNEHQRGQGRFQDAFYGEKMSMTEMLDQVQHERFFCHSGLDPESLPNLVLISRFHNEAQ